MGWPLEASRSLFPDWPWLCDESSPHRGALHIPVQILAGKFKMEFLPTVSCINLVPAAQDHFLSHRSVHPPVKSFQAALEHFLYNRFVQTCRDLTKQVRIIEHSPCRFDTIKFCQPQQQQSYPVIPPVSKSLWSSASESVLEYCRVVWDIFPPDTDDQKLIRFVVSDKPHNNKSTHVLNQWDVAEQNCLLVSAGLARFGHRHSLEFF